jgi:hypothetical protein
MVRASEREVSLTIKKWHEGDKNSAQRSNSYKKFEVQISWLSRVYSTPPHQTERDRRDGIAGPQ